MSLRKLPRDFGVAITCNHDGCTARHQTAAVYIRVNRTAAAAVGWMRGVTHRGGGSGRSSDFCPDHAPAERARVAEHKKTNEERKRARNEKRKVARVDPLTLACSACNAAPGVACRVMTRGHSFVGGRPPRATNRTRKPHPERTSGASV